MSREVHLVRYPQGAVTAADFALAEAELPDLGDNEVRVDVAWLSMDPVVRTRMTATPAMGPPMALGAAVPGRGVGLVVASRAAALPEGVAVYGELGWRDTVVLPAAALEPLAGDAPLHHHLNALGPTGLAAWFLVDGVAPQRGETMLIAPGAGAVGSLVAQLALGLGVRVVGTAVGARQTEYLRSLGVMPLDPGGDLPGGIDIFIDGIGGAFHDRAMQRLAPRGRVRLLGFLSDYASNGPPRYGSMGPVLMKRARVEGFLLADHMDRAAQARAALAAQLDSGALRPAETIWDGLDQAPHAFASLFADAGPGKQLVRVRDTQ